MKHVFSAKPLQRIYPAVIISLCAAFLFYKYVLQVYPSIITEPLMRDFHLTGAGLGNLAATFYYSYVVTQLFVGIILDKYSTRWLTAAAIFCSALGVVSFAQTQVALHAGLSRALMGMGVAFATVAYMKLASAWFPPRRYAFVAGLLATAAMAGAVFGEAPLSWWVNEWGWRYCLTVIGCVGFGFAFLFAVVVRDSPATFVVAASRSPTISLKDIWTVFKNKQNWLLTFYSGLAFSPVAVFGGLWGNPFLQQAYVITRTEAASLLSLVFIGLGIGSPLLGMLSDRLGKRRNVMIVSTFVSCIAITLVLYCHPMPFALVGFLLFIFGFALGAFMLVFTIGKELNSLRLTATVIALINTSEAVLDAITEPGIGKLLDLGWDGKIVNDVHYFSLHSYHIALAILPIYLLVGTILLFWVKDNVIPK